MNNNLVQLTLTLEQTQAVVDACDAYARLCMGQIEVIEQLARLGVIKCADGNLASPEQCEKILLALHEIKHFLGHHANSSFGIGNQSVPTGGHRTWEVKKVLEKTLAEHRNPTPSFRGVNYDGLFVRYTTDPAPVAVIVNQEGD